MHPGSELLGANLILLGLMLKAIVPNDQKDLPLGLLQLLSLITSGL